MANLTYQYILDSLKREFQKNNLTILDYGCGDGSFAKFLPHKKIKKYLGLDINHNSIKKARQNFANQNSFRFKLINPQKLIKLRPNQTNIVISIGVLQYLTLKQIDNLFKQVSLNLVKRGIFIFSCTNDHLIYKILNIYQLFLPHSYINKKHLLKILKKYDFKIVSVQEKGLILTPLFSNIFIFFFDMLDKILFGTKGELGPVGMRIRRLFSSIIRWEYGLPINFGFTLFLKIKK